MQIALMPPLHFEEVAGLELVAQGAVEELELAVIGVSSPA